MPNQSGNAYGLTTMCPMISSSGRDESLAGLVRDRLNDLPTDQNSPLSRVPNTYFVRLFVLDNVVYQGSPARLDALKNKYLVFNADFHGELRPYLRAMWASAEPFIRNIWEYCVGFGAVTDATSFVRYIEKCQVTTTFYFNGSNDQPLDEQLKALYLKQELSKFVCEHQGRPAAELQAAFLEFVKRTRPANLAGPTWRAGGSELESVVVGET